MSSNNVVQTQTSQDVVLADQIDLTPLGLTENDIPKILEANKELGQIDTLSIAEFGKNIGAQTSAHTDKLLDLVKNKDLDETGVKLNQVVSVAKELNINSLIENGNKKGVVGFLLKKFRSVKGDIQAQVNTTKEQIEALVNEVDKSQEGLKSRVLFLETMFNAVTDEHHLLGIYAAAGELKQKEIDKEVTELKSIIDPDNNVIQKIYNLNNLSNALEKRVSDLKILQQSARQTLPMIRVIQSNNSMIIDKFYAIKTITLPLWKNQISLALSLNEQKNGVMLANAIDETTNTLLKTNAALLHQNSVDTAKANQRSVIDVETLEEVQKQLIGTVQDVIAIHKDGKKQRQEAETKLKQLQTNMNTIVLENTTKQ